MFRTYLASILRPSSLAILLLLALVSAFIWFFGDSISVANMFMLESQTSRLIAIGVLFLSYFVSTFLRHYLARRMNAHLIKSMLANEELVSVGGDQSSDEIDLIRERFEKTLKTLQEKPLDGRRRSTYLFDLPWYIIIGPPGAGKTTILRNSGLNFPLAEPGAEALQGMGGTRYCDWWISNEAVLIDTAGRYTTQDVNKGVDAAAWSGFLSILRQHRRRRPVNGILLSISIADVAMASEAERQKHAEILRQRLRELHRSFEIRLPVYVMFTKCDLISGFEEYFDAVTESEREQVWGVTFPLDDEQATFGAQFEAGFLDLVARVEQRLPVRLGAERNNTRRCKIYSFPHEFGSLAPVLRSFITDVFKVSRYEAQPLLRGVYFTSGTQEGTPFDRLLGAMGRSFGLASASQLPMSGQGKAFFIKKLLTDIIFPEQNVVGRNTRLERRLVLLHSGAYAALAAGALAISGYWIYGLNNSLSQINSAEQKADQVKVQFQAANQDGSLQGILPALNEAQSLQSSVTTSPWNVGNYLSIDARADLAPSSGKVYDSALKNYLLPAMTSRLLTQIQLLSNSAKPDNMLLRDQLETYLMLTTGENFDKKQVEAELDRQAEAVFVIQPGEQARMKQHIDNLVSMLPAATPVDNYTVQAARSRLEAVPQANDVYSRMVSDAVNRYRLAPISVASIIGTGSLRLDPTSNSGVIPGIYTRNGFYEFFLPRLPDYVRRSTGTDWVLGQQGLSTDAYNALAQQVVEAYVRDYIAAWHGAMNGVRLVDFDSLPAGQKVLQDLSNPQSSLVLMLQKLRENTELPLPGSSDSNAANAAGQAAGAAGGGVAAAAVSGLAGQATDALARTAASTAFGNAPWPGTTIRNAFLPLTSLVDPQNPQGGLGQVQQLFGDLFGTVSSIATAPSPDSAAFDLVSQRAKNPTNDTFSRLRAEAATKPEPIRSMVTSAVNRTWQIMMRQGYIHLNNRWQQEILPTCNSMMANRYPFSPSAKEEVSLQDFAELFRPAGIIDQFFKDNMSPFVNVRGRRFTEVNIQGSGMGFSQEALSQFTRAATIRDAFFTANATVPAARFTVEPSFLDPQALRASFVLDDAELIYRHGPVRGMDFTWPSKLDSSVAMLRLVLVNGDTQTIQQRGNWAIFRLFSGPGVLQNRGQDQFDFSISKDNVRATFRLRASSVVNPFNVGLYSAFNCPPAL